MSKNVVTLFSGSIGACLSTDLVVEKVFVDTACQNDILIADPFTVDLVIGFVARVVATALTET